MFTFSSSRDLTGVLMIVALAGCTRADDSALADRIPSTARVEHVEATLEGLSAVTRLQSIDDPRVALGKELFADARLSRDNTVSCRSCHVINRGGADGLVTAVGIEGQVGPINTPTVLNSGLNFAQFWDGRAATLEEQVPGPIHNPVEMGTDLTDVVAKLGADTKFARRFGAVYPTGVSAANVVDAIATYERALVALDSPFDRYLGGDTSAISAQAERGYRAFLALGCVSCHQGPNVGGNMYQRFGIMGDYFADRGHPTDADLGRFRVTGRERDKYVFKVPSLRNVANTAPYFHDGSAATLEDAVNVMIKYQLGRSVNDDERHDIVAFLKSLEGRVEDSLL